VTVRKGRLTPRFVQRESGLGQEKDLLLFLGCYLNRTKHFELNKYRVVKKARSIAGMGEKVKGSANCKWVPHYTFRWMKRKKDVIPPMGEKTSQPE